MTALTVAKTESSFPGVLVVSQGDHLLGFVYPDPPLAAVYHDCGYFAADDIGERLTENHPTASAAIAAAWG